MKRLLIFLLLAASTATAQLKPGAPATTAASLTGGPITIDGGSNTAPAYSFTGDTNTGFYRTGAESLGLTTAGTLRLTVSQTAVVSTLAISNALGAVTTPAYSFTGDLNTGMWSSTGDALEFSTGGTLAISIDANQDVIIEGGRISVEQGSVGAPSYSFEADPNTGMYGGGDVLAFTVGGIDHLSMDGTNMTIESTTLIELGGANMNAGGIIELATGAASAPSYTFTSDVNTGMFRIGADSVGLATVGVGRFSVQGATNILSTLPIRGSDGAVGDPSFAFNSDADGTGTGIYRSAANALSIANNGVLTVTLDASGNTDFQDGNIVTTGTLGAAATTLSGNLAMGANDVTGFDRIQTTDALSTLLSATGIFSYTQMYHSLTADAAQTLDSLVTINGGTAGGLIVLRAADTDDIFIDVGGGNIRGTDRLLDDVSDTYMAIFDGTNWLEVSFSDQGGGVIYTGAVTTGALSAAAGTFTGVVNVPDGVVGAPSVASTSDADGTGTGLYWSAADALSVANNGVLTVTFDASGNTDFQDGNIVTTGTFGSGAITSTGTSSFGQSSFSDTTNVSNQLQVGTGIAYANADVLLASAAVQIGFDETDGAADNRVWDIEIEGEQFRWRTVNDAISVAVNWLEVDRTGTVVDSVHFPGSTVVFSDGAVGNPVIQFSNDNDGTGTGFYRSAADALSLANNGVLTVTYDASGNTDFQDGNITTTGTFGSGAITVTTANNVEQLILEDATADATTKDAFITGSHFTNAEENWTLITGRSDASDNTINIGSDPGTSTQNAATILGFYTAANQTTLGGTIRMRINTTSVSMSLPVEMNQNDLNNFGQLRTNVASTLTLAPAGAITFTRMYHGVTADAAQTLDSLVTINGGTEGDFLILTAADTDDIFIDVDGGNINGTDRTLDGTGDTWIAIFDGTNWTEISFSDND